MQIGYIVVLCALVGLIAGAQADAKDIKLIKDGRSHYTIVLARGASPSEKHAARELKDFLFEISGARLPIITEGGWLPKKMIVLGDGDTLRSLKMPIDFKDLGDEGFAIKTAGQHLIIAGGRLRGTMYGVYTFLEDVLGCRWYTPDASHIPRSCSITLKPLDIVQKPDFEYREPYYTGAWDADWAARNKVNGNRPALDDARGGKVVYARFCHTFDEIAPMAKYFKDHPEYYSLLNGERKGGQRDGQLCLTNPDVLRIATEKVFQWIEENPKAKIFSVTQNDNVNYCRCDKCKAVDEEEGSPSGLMLRFVNAIADEVAKKYPDKLIDTFAYQYTEKPPKITKPRPNVRVRLCPISNCQHHPYERCEQNAGFMDNLRGWYGITDTLYIWHYNTVFPNYLLPLPDLEELAADIPMYKRFGVKGIFTQGTYNAGRGPAGGAGFMDDLKAYMIAKLLWNINTDARAVIADFLGGYFGKAGKPVSRFLDLLHDKVRGENIHGNIWQGVDAAFLTSEIMAEGERLFDKAEKVADSPEILERVKHARLSLEYVKVIRQALSAGANGTPEQKSAALKRLEAFIEECKADGVTQLAEWCSIDTSFEQLAGPLRK